MSLSFPGALRSAANVSRFAGRGTTMIDRVVVIDDYSVARGGATGLAVLSAKLFRGLDIPVTYICGDDAANAELAALGVAMVGLNSRDLLSAERAKAFVTGIHNGAAARMVANWIAAKDTANTVYHVHGWHQILSPALFRALALVAGRCVIHAHDFFTACPNGAFFDYQAQEICLRRPLGAGCIATACDKRSYSHKLWRLARGSNILRLLRAEADFGRIILLHEKMAGFLVGAGYRAERLTTIRNPVAPLSIGRVEAEANDEFVFIGRLDAEKGVEDAVAATRRAGARLCVIGDGPLMPLVAASGDHVRAVGWQSHAEIGTTIRKARALLMPSRYPEPFGLVAIEAARSGLPVIMSRSAFLAEEMERAGMAFACDTADEAAFADTLTRFSQMPRHEIRAMSERAFLMSPDLASTHEEWRDALLAEYCSLLSTNAVRELTDGVATQGVFR
ncbi:MULTISPECIES: glycosyltransferase [Rhizobium]|uniref:glycosyltransferase family 4 protein n=1 Tax=Rhizobium TaxID=379 RepID=UPI001B3410FA|nr:MULTISPECIES: glycosyltransferase [Rhizobium]MBX4910539.1 glycosyltransferase [Rhizobium bangladeshense]MBX5218208.1 glycosyltransferase [Rhizobium sp. NLR9a]MBX5235932.1 glycosyltransferase [Rhizobium sp. NLR4a]MBX5248245.1 glycosyltransferase [Rhizobium sp. NLR3b]MBX5253083.1 glycosyltransferase [Rhizobium sp. NLR4b]